MRWPRRRWLIVRYLDGAHPQTMSRHWTGLGAEGALSRWRAWNAASEMPERAHYQFVIAHRGRR